MILHYIESRRDDDLSIWQSTTIPAFEAAHPGIAANCAPSAPAGYDAVPDFEPDAGSAGDIITRRPLDASPALEEAGHLAAVGDLEGMSDFSDAARAGWSTDDGAATCRVPMTSVIHGFIHFEEAATGTEFFEVLPAPAEDDGHVPMAMGINDQREVATRATPTSDPPSGAAS